MVLVRGPLEADDNASRVHIQSSELNPPAHGRTQGCLLQFPVEPVNMSLDGDYTTARQLARELESQLEVLEQGSDESNEALRAEASKNVNAMQQAISRLQGSVTGDMRARWKPCVPRRAVDGRIVLCCHFCSGFTVAVPVKPRAARVAV